jgi:hypothetical protein
MSRHTRDLTVITLPLESITQEDKSSDTSPHRGKLLDWNALDCLWARHGSDAFVLDYMTGKASVRSPSGSEDTGASFNGFADDDDDDKEEYNLIPLMEKAAANLNLDQFEGRYVHLEAGPHTGFFQDIALLMNTPGTSLYRPTQTFQTRPRTLGHTRESSCELANAIGKHIWQLEPAPKGHEREVYRDVFLPNGKTSVLDRPEDSAHDGPRPSYWPFA